MWLFTLLSKINPVRLLIIIVVTCFVFVLIVFSCFLFIETYKSKVVPIETAKNTDIGIVFGSGINVRGEPNPQLQARLDVAYDAYQKQIIKKIIISGDNRSSDYNEPQAMYDYLIERSVPASDLQMDFAGRSTYETCERASKVFQVQEAVLITSASHLPRALFLCDHFGISAQGLASTDQNRLYIFREPLARIKAIFNAYIWPRDTILGSPIEL